MRRVPDPPLLVNPFPNNLQSNTLPPSSRLVLPPTPKTVPTKVFFIVALRGRVGGPLENATLQNNLQCLLVSLTPWLDLITLRHFSLMQ